MGGMIAQMLAVRHPGKVLTLTSIMSTTGHRLKGNPALQGLPLLPRRAAEGQGEGDRARRSSSSTSSARPASSATRQDFRDLASRSIDRGPGDDAGTGRQLAAILASGNRTAQLRRITAPTLVIHGKNDRLVNASGGRATARAIPGARLELIDGMGHDLPRQLWPRFVDLITRHAQSVERSRQPVA